jgi:hypothetical protein
MTLDEIINLPADRAILIPQTILDKEDAEFEASVRKLFGAKDC